MSDIIDVQISQLQKYGVIVGENLDSSFVRFCNNRFSGDRIYVMIDEKVNRLHGSNVEKMCSKAFERVMMLEVPEGETSKSMSEWNKHVNTLLEEGVERSTPLLAVGGGVTGDLGGFVAASVLRGIPLLHMPTSLLAMVDSSIGGKTGINHETGKNLIGAFYQPDAVFTDISFLETLEHAEWITGMAEILKYAAIDNPTIFDKLQTLVDDSLSPKDQWQNVIRESVRIKVDIVQQDALEAGKRAYLNFGHTFGHALENLSGYGELSHGEAVFVGMIAATYFSAQLGHPVDDTRFAPFISSYKQQMATLPEEVDQLINAMKLDKKVKNNTIRLVLLNEWGSPYIHECTDYSLLQESWEYALSQFN
ncbi:3-dehydroquinate synthase [Fodinibius halophilus]|uniref:3-dehydroquinate synthase n=1 Tax=Fodinibius halophilus TaxID=1736908 RepID=A0A6M1T673_9BACT|nr:3-dehydroquinate synthase [Fodinibius halophilus]NGP86764.1 3-dehydroquinate synthase [Fodinibius halophilus]